MSRFFLRQTFANILRSCFGFDDELDGKFILNVNGNTISQLFSSDLFQKFPFLIAKEIDFVLLYSIPFRELIDPGPVERKFHYLFVSGFIKDKLPLPGCFGLNLNN